MLNKVIFMICVAMTTSQFIEQTQKVYLPNVTSLLFHRGHYTFYSYNKAGTNQVPQLTCYPGNNLTKTDCNKYGPYVVRCHNKGINDDLNIIWECEGNTGDYFKFGNIDIKCKGYYGSNNPYVLEGSCSLNYKLELTSKGEEWVIQQNINNRWNIFAFIIAAIGFIMLVIEIDRGERARNRNNR